MGTAKQKQEGANGAAATLVPAGPDDLEPIRQLLATLYLPAADVGRPGQTFLVVREGSQIVGCVGLEGCGPDALLRSLAVVPRLQGQGLGRALYEAVLEQARRQGVGTLYLLDGMGSRRGSPAPASLARCASHDAAQNSTCRRTYPQATCQTR